MFVIPKSIVSRIAWPAVPDPNVASFLALQHQFGKTERLPAPELEQRQFEALARLLRHACDTVPYYRDRPAYREVLDAGALDARAWRRLPLLTRPDLQDAGNSIRSEAVPEDHLPLNHGLTSGSTGRPVNTVGTAATRAFWHALTLREHLWHGRDSRLRVAAIRAEGSDKIPPEGRVGTGWGSAIGAIYPQGSSVMLGISNDIAHQARWLVEQRPDYLLSLPSNLVALARHCLDNGIRLERLRGLTTYGEMVTPDVRTACRDAWGVEVSDIYSSQEVGYIALQCERLEGLHVQAESVYVEVLDDRDEPSRPGHVGRVIVSGLHNWAMPLFRYEVGDDAEVGDSCACGRGLPVLTRVVGRRRNMLRLPTGEVMWPRLPAHVWSPVAPSILQLQVVQDELDHIEARMVTSRQLTAEEKTGFIAVLQLLLTYPFRVTLTSLDVVDRTSQRKFDDFVSRL